MTCEWTFLYGFFVGQFVLVLTAWLLIKHLLLTKGKGQKYEPLSLSVSRRQQAGKSKHSTKEESAELETLNFLIKELHDSALLENILERVSLLANQAAPTVHPLLHELGVQAIQLDSPPILKAITKDDEGAKVTLEWTKGPSVTLKGEVGRHGLYLPFLAHLNLQLLKVLATIQVRKHHLLSLSVSSLDLDFESDISIGHAIQLHDTQGLLKDILHSLIKRHTSALLDTPIQVSLNGK